MTLGLDKAPALTERISRRARRIRVELRADGEVVLTIPWRASRTAAYRFLEGQSEWIARERARLRALPPALPAPSLRWDGTDSIPLRGVPLPLRVETLVGRRALVEVSEQNIVLRVPLGWLGQERRLQRLLMETLKSEARRDGLRLLDEESKKLGLRYAGLTLRDPRSRWGSCAPDGRVMLSLRLVLAPPEVFRYVAVHELCHRRWRSHGPRFWTLVARQMPEFETQRAWLRQHGDTVQTWPPR